MAPQAKKKNKGYGTSASAASENFKIPSFQSFGRSGGRARGPPKVPKNPSPLFFFFSPKIQNYAMSHNSVYGAISLFHRWHRTWVSRRCLHQQLQFFFFFFWYTVTRGLCISSQLFFLVPKNISRPHAKHPLVMFKMTSRTREKARVHLSQLFLGD